MKMILAILIFFALGTGAIAQGDPKLNGNLELGSLTTHDGSVYLIREIRGEFKPGFKGPFTMATGLVSYSINPLRYLTKAAVGMSTSAEGVNAVRHILISRQSILKPGLFYSPAERPAPEIKTYRGYLPVTSSVRVRDISETYYEIAVQQKEENVMLVITQEQLANALNGIGDVDTIEQYREMISKMLRIKPN